MKIDSKIDAFVTRINAAPQESLSPEDVPKPLRIGDPDEYGQFRWIMKKADCSRWLSGLQYKLPKKFPPSYYSLISRYMFPAFQLGPVFMFGNTGENLYWELQFKLFKDEFMSHMLFENGYLHIGHPEEANYDPICFDMKKGEEAPIVQIDHEEILCRSRIQVVKEIAPSFLELIENY